MQLRASASADAFLLYVWKVGQIPARLCAHAAVDEVCERIASAKE